MKNRSPSAWKGLAAIPLTKHDAAARRDGAEDACGLSRERTQVCAPRLALECFVGRVADCTYFAATNLVHLIILELSSGFFNLFLVILLVILAVVHLLPMVYHQYQNRLHQSIAYRA